ncbi:Nif3-like dinuclear metal center hexameric protein [Alkalibacter saccharofermentans]|uniref:GTP cyclohydrolase 1 type 2 homolog n=1 Tax=Alkalibacter saccharofermentans DSM 14828 TaxID=1120975 RepID=A0A1M4Z2V3_9FIRM|nr:Nif3-like dinuclear metal center hexameric protein [Alkalibacter saccharofermentans]SHF12285.1 dinuclear metal center protein, YbgI/SA1388 family [Alkalibacter saccharofermentans DSM 14828]
MSLKCSDILNIIDGFAPFDLAEKWDNVGLLIGDKNQEVNNILLSLDVTEDVVDEAVEKQADLIISHHPLIFSGVKEIRWDKYQGRTIQKLIKNDISVICAHTNLDISPEGINVYLGELLGLLNVKPLMAMGREKLFKLAVFVPASHLEEVKKSLFSAGAGHIGNYENCSFETQGTGQFMPMTGAEPFLGDIDKLEHVDEMKLEVLVEYKFLDDAVSAIFKAHPYEEPAYDIYPLENKGKAFGLGILGSLKNPMDLEKFIKMIKKTLNLDIVRLSGEEKAMVKKIAVCSGSGADLLSRAKSSGADLLITGDVKYHDGQKAHELDICLLDAGHFATEIIVKDLLFNKLLKYMGGGTSINVIKSDRDTGFLREI